MTPFGYTVLGFGSGTSGVSAIDLVLSAGANNQNIKTLALAAGGDVDTDVNLTINGGVTIGSTSAGTAALITDTGWSSGVTITITNNGSIVGANGADVTGANSAGGHAGRGGEGNECGYPIESGQAGQAGASGSGTAHADSDGGDAFEHSQTGDDNLAVVFATAGTRTGGSAGTTTYAGGGGCGGGGNGGGLQQAGQAGQAGNGYPGSAGGGTSSGSTPSGSAGSALAGNTSQIS